MFFIKLLHQLLHGDGGRVASDVSMSYDSKLLGLSSELSVEISLVFLHSIILGSLDQYQMLYASLQ